MEQIIKCEFVNTEIGWRSTLCLGHRKAVGINKRVFIGLFRAGGRVAALGGESELGARPELQEEERLPFRQKQRLGLVPPCRVSDEGNSSGALPVVFVNLRRGAVNSIIVIYKHSVWN